MIESEGSLVGNINSNQSLTGKLSNGVVYTGGFVDDVRVDGVSVVENRIANIQLKQAVINILIEYGLIQDGELNNNQVSDIEQLIVSYFENKKVMEVEE